MPFDIYNLKSGCPAGHLDPASQMNGMVGGAGRLTAGGSAVLPVNLCRNQFEGFAKKKPEWSVRIKQRRYGCARAFW
jgi:hypothetical protein